MSDTQLSKRLISSHGRVSSTRLKTGKFHQEDWEKMHLAVGQLKDYPILIDEKTGDVDQLIFETKNLDKTLKGGVSMVICDYAQLMEGKGFNREQEVGYISRKMKLLAKDLNIPVILLSQLNREVDKRKEKIPVLSDLRESGSIEQDADIILFIYRDEVYNDKSDRKGLADIIIGKHRNGATGAIELKFIGQFVKFTN